MPKTATRPIFETPPDPDHEARLDAIAARDHAEGRVVAHERAREWLTDLAQGRKRPPPDP